MRLIYVAAVVAFGSLAVGCADAGEALDDEGDHVLEQVMDGGGRTTGVDAGTKRDASASTSGADAGAGGDAAAASSGSGGGITMVGTWFTKVDAKAEITAPLVGTAVSDVALALKLYVTEENGELKAEVSTCNLDTKSGSLSLNFDHVEPYIKLTKSIPSFDAKVGGKVPLPEVTFEVGQDASGAAVDVDEDGKPGVTVNSTALGAVPFDAYVGLTLTIAMDATLKDEQTVSGTATFDSKAKIFGSGIPLVTSGDVTVKQVQGPVAFAAKHQQGDVPCADLMKE